MNNEKIIFSRKRGDKNYKKKADLLRILQSESYANKLNSAGVKAMASDTVVELFDKADFYNKLLGNIENDKPMLVPKEVAELERKIKETFSVNERFEFLEQFTRMVVKNKTPSLVVVGEGGLGKTYTVKKVIKDLGLDESCYKFMRGHCTPFELYKLLYDNRDELIIFDDCDSVLDDKTSQNLLKNACDSYDIRTLNWASNAAVKAGYEQEFDFTGRIIFISNKSKSKIFQPLLSRSFVVDLEMTVDEKLERMLGIAEHFALENDYNINNVFTSVDFLTTNKHLCANLTMRSLISIVKIIESDEKNWERLALYKVMNE